jgi:hypothetical protein
MTIAIQYIKHYSNMATFDTKCVFIITIALCLGKPESIHTFIFLSFYMDRAQWKGENINFIVDFTTCECLHYINEYHQHVFDFFDHVMQDWRDALTNFILISVKSLEISWSIMIYGITSIIHGNVQLNANLHTHMFLQLFKKKTL